MAGLWIAAGLAALAILALWLVPVVLRRQLIKAFAAEGFAFEVRGLRWWGSQLRFSSLRLAAPAVQLQAEGGRVRLAWSPLRLAELEWRDGQLSIPDLDHPSLNSAAEPVEPSRWWPHAARLGRVGLRLGEGHWACSEVVAGLQQQSYKFTGAALTGPIAPISFEGTWDLRSDALSLSVAGQNLRIDGARLAGIPWVGPWLRENLRPSGSLRSLFWNWQSQADASYLQADLEGARLLPVWWPVVVVLLEGRLEVVGQRLTAENLRGEAQKGSLEGRLEAQLDTDSFELELRGNGLDIEQNGLAAHLDAQLQLRYDPESGLRGPITAQARCHQALQASGLGVMFLGLSTLKTLADALNRGALAAAFSWVQDGQAELRLTPAGCEVVSALLRGEVLTLAARGSIGYGGELDLRLSRSGSEGVSEAGSLLTALARGLSDVTPSSGLVLRVQGSLERPRARLGLP